MVFFTNGGAGGTENAIRMARLHTGRHKVLTTYRSYHGATGAAITMTGDPRRWPSEPGAVGMVKFWGPYPYRSAFFSADEAQESERALQHLADVIMVEGAHTVAAIVLETVVGTNGILVPPPGYLQGVRDLCDQHGIVMICDEVMAGFGRCGEWFAVDHWNVAPDLICFAKGINSGYVPLGGVVISRRIADTFKERRAPEASPTRTPTGLRRRPSPPSPSSRKRGSRARPHARGPTSSARHCASSRSATRRSARSEASACSGPSSSCATATREPLVPYNAAGDAAAPINEVVAACKAKGVWPFTHFNRIHVVPP